MRRQFSRARRKRQTRSLTGRKAIQRHAAWQARAAHALLTELPKPEQLLPPIDLQSLESIARPLKDRYGQPLLSTEAPTDD
jgi:hypothetical protein